MHSTASIPGPVALDPTATPAARELAKLVNAKELGAILRRSPAAIRQCAFRGVIPAVRLGGALLFDPDAVLAALRPVAPATATPSPTDSQGAA